jgi:hypothetical protein
MLSADGKLAAGVYGQGEDDRLGVWDTSSGRQVFDRNLPRQNNMPGSWRTSAIAGSGSHVAVAATLRESEAADARVWIEIRVYELSSGRETRMIRVDGIVPTVFPATHGLTLSRGGERVALATYALARRAVVLDVATGLEVLTLTSALKGYIRKVAFTPDGHRLVTLAESRNPPTWRLLIWDATPRPTETDAGH